MTKLQRMTRYFVGPAVRALYRACRWIKTETMIQIAQSETFAPVTGFYPSIDAYRRFYLGKA